MSAKHRYAFVTTDYRQSWNSIANNLPPLSVRDLRVHPREDDLIISVGAAHRFDLSQESYEAQSEATLALRDRLSESNVMINGVEAAERQLGELKEKLDADADSCDRI